MTDQFVDANKMVPITPPPELVDQWWSEVGEVRSAGFRIALHIATQAARWGADQELEACCEWLDNDDFRELSEELRAARRPKPPSLKEQALEILNARFDALPPIDAGTIRRALESLPS